MFKASICHDCDRSSCLLGCALVVCSMLLGSCHRRNTYLALAGGVRLPWPFANHLPEPASLRMQPLFARRRQPRHFHPTPKNSAVSQVSQLQGQSILDRVERVRMSQLQPSICSWQLDLEASRLPSHQTPAEKNSFPRRSERFRGLGNPKRGRAG